MGCRITDNLMHSDYEMFYLEVGDEGKKKLAEKGVDISDQNVVLPGGDLVILAVPDVALEKVSSQIVPMMKSGALLITLDPAAALAGKIFSRDGVYSIVKLSRGCYFKILFELYL